MNSPDYRITQKKQAITDLLFHVSNFWICYNPNSFWIFSTLSIFSQPKNSTSLKYLSFPFTLLRKRIRAAAGELFVQIALSYTVLPEFKTSFTKL